MKFKITTVYENCDQEWLDCYYECIAKDGVLPGGGVIVEELIECGYAVYSSKDPTSPVTGTTTYEVLK